MRQKSRNFEAQFCEDVDDYLKALKRLSQHHDEAHAPTPSTCVGSDLAEGMPLVAEAFFHSCPGFLMLAVLREPERDTFFGR
ncbi:hypothetical protein NL676_005900 [Syzygium grande]|nr:hypothetical protein NL676_005900 [Syzygium grande]